MKKILVPALLLLSVTACHYGRSESEKTLETNEQYKNEKSEFSTNRGNEGVMPEHTRNMADTLTADSSKK